MVGLLEGGGRREEERAVQRSELDLLRQPKEPQAGAVSGSNWLQLAPIGSAGENCRLGLIKYRALSGLMDAVESPRGLPRACHACLLDSNINTPVPIPKELAVDHW